jgi:hypothetical protein
MPTGTCFVVMGFGKKTDFQTGRVLDLNKSYQYMIKPAAEEAGLECVRADEIVHAGLIDVPMYRQLLTADVVIADLSTSNPNAFYELGVRHALRPYTTITIAESKLIYPFDVSHITIQRYEHMGEDIGYGEVVRFRTLLKDAIVKILQRPENDSPVYEFLNGLNPPALVAAVIAVAAAAPVSADPTIGVLMEQVESAKKSGNWIVAKTLLNSVRLLRKDSTGVRAEDPYILQQLALATYKSAQPTPLKALEEARDILSELDPASSHDTETIGLWGAVHKRLYDLTQDRAYLDAAIAAYEKGFYLRNDYYNGTNAAFLFNVRAALSPPSDAIADFVLAQRIRRQAIVICEGLLASGRKLDDEYWVRATLAEAWLGLGDAQKSQEALDGAAPFAEAWMRQSTAEQLAKLKPLLDKSPLKALG